VHDRRLASADAGSGEGGRTRSRLPGRELASERGHVCAGKGGRASVDVGAGKRTGGRALTYIRVEGGQASVDMHAGIWGLGI
jgi:hypothetical protein